jgi:hypothetical protein
MYIEAVYYSAYYLRTYLSRLGFEAAQKDLSSRVSEVDSRGLTAGILTLHKSFTG